MTDLTDAMRVTISRIDGYVSRGIFHKRMIRNLLETSHPLRRFFSRLSHTRQFNQISRFTQTRWGLLGRLRPLL